MATVGKGGCYGFCEHGEWSCLPWFLWVDLVIVGALVPVAQVFTVS